MRPLVKLVGQEHGETQQEKERPEEISPDRLLSTTDPDATPMRLGREGQTKLGYQAHYVVDGGKARVILNVLVTPSEVSENRPMLDLLWRTAFRWRLWPGHVTGDAKYGTAENVSAIESAGIRAYVAPHESGGKGKAFFGKGEFVYDPERGLYLCPAGEELHRAGKSGKSIRYRAGISACRDCPLKERCTPGEGVRSINRYPSEEYVERVRAYRHTEPYKKAMRKRMVWVEPLFAEAKDWHGMRRFRLRRLEKVNVEALLIASGQNAKRLLAFGGRRPQKLAQAAALLRPPTGTGMRPVVLGSIVRTALGRQQRHFSTAWAVPTASVSSFVSYPSSRTRKGAGWSRKMESLG